MSARRHSLAFLAGLPAIVGAIAACAVVVALTLVTCAAKYDPIARFMQRARAALAERDLR